MTPQELQSLRNLGNECERAADAIVALQARVAELEQQNVTFRAAQKACEDCDAPTMAEVAKMRADLAAAQKDLSVYKSARFGYASEFPFTADGEPDVGNIHANIRAMKADLAAARALLMNCRHILNAYDKAYGRGENFQRYDLPLLLSGIDAALAAPGEGK